MFKVGVIVDSLEVQEYIADILLWIKKEKDLDLHLIVQNIPKNSICNKNNLLNIFFRFFKSYPKLILWKVINFTENYYLKKHNLNSIFNFIEIKSLTKKIIFVVPNISKKGDFFTYSKKDLYSINNCNLDLIIKSGSGILRGDILSISKFGIISLSHTFDRLNKRRPACFWEVFYCEPKTGFVIQKLNEVLDGGDILFRGAFPTQKFYLLNLANIYIRSNYYIKSLIKTIATDKKLPNAENNFPLSRKSHKLLSLESLFKYLCKNLFYEIFKNFLNTKILKKAQRWSVSYSFTNWREIEMWKSKKILNPPNRFLADPFLYKNDESYYCFVEDYDYEIEKADISVFKINSGGEQFLGKALIEDFHLSFPYLIEISGNLYMIPESHKKRQIRLYKCVNFPLKWELEKILIDNISAADSVVFFKEGLWWMLTNIDPLDGSDHSSNLSIFYSEDILTKEWKPHKLNPIYTDPFISRNAGLIREGNKIFRFSQKCGFCKYGESTNIHYITNINKESYKEELIGSVKPDFLLDIVGTHHFDSKDNCSVFDHQTFERKN